jgi:hypothetical protein
MWTEGAYNHKYLEKLLEEMVTAPGIDIYEYIRHPTTSVSVES